MCTFRYICLPNVMSCIQLFSVLFHGCVRVTQVCLIWMTFDYYAVSLVKCTTFSSNWRDDMGCCIPPKSRLWVAWWLWKDTVVMCGKWNVRQATLQQMFKVTIFCMGTYFQSFSPLINCIVHRAVLKFSPCRNNTLPQLVRIADWCSIHVKKIKKMKNVCILQGSVVTF